MTATVDRAVSEPLGDILLRLRGGHPRRVHGSTEVVITSITHDSRDVVSGSLFCCVPGGRVDGHDFALVAVAAGARALLVERLLDIPLSQNSGTQNPETQNSGTQNFETQNSETQNSVTQIVVQDVRTAMGYFAASLFRHPCDELTVVGVTGTNGKTTTTHLLAAIFNEAGRPAGVIGTIGAARTTPESTDLQRRLRSLADNGKQSVMMEVSSHALVLHRVNGCHFAAAVFTNLGHDHLDLHETQERYFAAKALLFEPSLSTVGIANVDDVHGRLLVDAQPITMIGYSAARLADVEVSASSHSYTWVDHRVTVPIGARFNVENSLAAATTARALDIDVDTIVAGLARTAPVPGRFESIEAGQSFSVVVDYAHTPDGLAVALASAREVAGSKRVIVVFGCGGDRDAHKRAPMGETAARLADLTIVTSDNPRTEDPMSIIEAAVAGVPSSLRQRVSTQVDRRLAIEEAFALAGEGDVVVIAGKGHEATQTIGTSVGAFDDRVVAREILESLQ